MCGKCFKDKAATEELTEEDIVIPATSDHSLTHVDYRAATCTVDGSIEYWQCEVCGKYFSDADATTEIEEEDTVIAATDHDWGDPVWTWTDEQGNNIEVGDDGKLTDVVDGTVTATVTITCQNDSGHVLTASEVCDSTSEESTCTTAGHITYYVYVSVDGYGSLEKDIQVDLPLAAHTLEKVGEKEATCTEAGNIAYWKCSECGALFSDADAETQIDETDLVIGALGHDYEATVVAPTCTAEGYTIYTCSRGDDTYISDYTDRIAHSWDYDDITWTWADGHASATATYACSVCGTEETVDADVHIETTSATCTTKGDTDYYATLTVDGETYRSEDEHVYDQELGHSYAEGVWSWDTDADGDLVLDADGNATASVTITCTRGDVEETVTVTVVPETTAASCTADGKSVYAASVTYDGITYEDEQTVVLEKLGHDYEATTVVAPTCTEQGYTTYTCSRCGDTYMDDYTDALGHSWDYDNITWTWADGHASATATYACSVCGTEETVDADVHIETTSATCTTKGDTDYYATLTVDGETYRSEDEHVYDQELGHSYGEGVWSWSEDYSSATVTFTCSRCGNEQVVIAEVSVASTEPTCTADGEIAYTASAIFREETYTDSKTIRLEAYGHDYVDTVTEPTCTTDGYTTHTCSRCGDTYTDAYVDALGHDYVDTVTEPTCTTDGYTTHICSRCGDTYTDAYVDALGHDWGDPEWTWADDYSAATAGFTCGTCGTEEVLDADIVVDVAGNLTTYTATVVHDGQTYTSTKQVIAVMDDESLRMVFEVLAGEIMEIAPSLQETDYDTLEKVEAKMTEVAIENGGTEGNIAHYDIVLQSSTDGVHWENVTDDETNYLAGGVTFTIPYPEGTNGTDYDFVVVHMLTMAYGDLQPGDTEILDAVKTDDGLQVTVYSLSPITVSWTAVVSSEPSDGDEEETGTGEGTETGTEKGTEPETETTEEPTEAEPETETTEEPTEAEPETETTEEPTEAEPETEETNEIILTTDDGSTGGTASEDGSASSNSNTDGTTATTAPKTADAALFVWMLLLLAGAGLVVISAKRRGGNR